jgi:hypothetical protein
VAKEIQHLFAEITPPSNGAPKMGVTMDFDGKPQKVNKFRLLCGSMPSFSVVPPGVAPDEVVVAVPLLTLAHASLRDLLRYQWEDMVRVAERRFLLSATESVFTGRGHVGARTVNAEDPSAFAVPTGSGRLDGTDPPTVVVGFGVVGPAGRVVLPPGVPAPVGYHTIHGAILCGTESDVLFVTGCPPGAIVALHEPQRPTYGPAYAPECHVTQIIRDGFGTLRLKASGGFAERIVLTSSTAAFALLQHPALRPVVDTIYKHFLMAELSVGAPVWPVETLPHFPGSVAETFVAQCACRDLLGVANRYCTVCEGKGTVERGFPVIEYAPFLPSILIPSTRGRHGFHKDPVPGAALLGEGVVCAPRIRVCETEIAFNEASHARYRFLNGTRGGADRPNETMRVLTVQNFVVNPANYLYEHMEPQQMLTHFLADFEATEEPLARRHACYLRQDLLKCRDEWNAFIKSLPGTTCCEWLEQPWKEIGDNLESARCAVVEIQTARECAHRVLAWFERSVSVASGATMWNKFVNNTLALLWGHCAHWDAAHCVVEFIAQGISAKIPTFDLMTGVKLPSLSGALLGHLIDRRENFKIAEEVVPREEQIDDLFNIALRKNPHHSDDSLSESD